jgi:hypothetical protein
LALETFDHKIKDNLKRTLKFQVTLLRENKNYDSAIHFLKRIGELSEEPEIEKVTLEIEKMEDRIFEQVKRSNTLEDYEVFLARYPNSPKNSDDARRQIARMRPQVAGEMPTMEMADDERFSSPDMGLNSFVPESMEMPKSSMPGAVISEETIEIVAAEKPRSEEMQKEDEFPEGEPMLDPEPDIMDEPPAKKMKMSEEKSKIKKPPVKATAVKPIKKVKITTKAKPLNVRADPSSKSKVVAQLPTETIIPMFQENGQWYQIEYLPGKKGWISKKYSILVN